MNWSEATTLTITCGRGCASALRKELCALGYSPFELSPTAIGVEGNMHDAMRLNLWLRTANRVLFEMMGFEARTTDELYAAVTDLPWEEWLAEGVPFHIHGDAHAEELRDPRFALLRCKDAVADRFVRATGARPDSQSDPEGAACIALHWQAGEAHVHLDTSGIPLSRRGYRWRPWIAPLRENLAASILVEADWQPDHEALAGPMCGSGTLSIEAAWMAQRRAPGLHREAYAFQSLRDWPAGDWRELKEEARRQFRPVPAAWISATDSDARAVACAQENASRAGVEKLIRFGTADFRKAPLPPPPALIAMNPEYGERMGFAETLAPLYAAMGDDLKARCTGMRAAVFTGNPELARQIGLHPSRRIPMWNGALECRLLLYDLYAGTRDRRLLRKHSDGAKNAASSSSAADSATACE